MRPRRGDAQAGRAQQRRERAAQLQHLLPRFADVGADLRPHLDDRLHHLGLHAVAEVRTRRGKERVDVALQLTFSCTTYELVSAVSSVCSHSCCSTVQPRITPFPPYSSLGLSTRRSRSLMTNSARSTVLPS